MSHYYISAFQNLQLRMAVVMYNHIVKYTTVLMQVFTYCFHQGSCIMSCFVSTHLHCKPWFVHILIIHKLQLTGLVILPW